MASYSAVAKDCNITSYISLYLFNKTILLYFFTPFITFILLLLKAPYSGGLYKYCKSLYVLTISILSRDC